MAAPNRSTAVRPGRAWRTVLALLAAASLLAAGAGFAPAAAGSPKADGAKSQTRTAELRGKTTPRAAAKDAKEHPRKVHAPLPKHTIKPPRPGAAPKVPVEPTLVNLDDDRARGNALVTAAPPLVSRPEFDGIANADQAGAHEPPDPWIAVGPSHVLQVVNGLVRISSRAGAEIVTVPNWAFFGLETTEYDADPRIIYDAYHGRWAGVLISFQADLGRNYLIVAISETSDPLGAWTLYALPYGSDFPDYPGIASSTDKIVLTAQPFADDPATPDPAGGEVYAGADVSWLAWTEILSGDVIHWYGLVRYDNVGVVRPGQVLSPSADVQLVGDSLLDGVVYHSRVMGTPASATIADWTSLGMTIANAAAPAGLQPRQPGDPATIAKAVDARITDAVWRDGYLWFVMTYAVTSNQGATWDLGARISRLTVTAGVPSLVDDTVFVDPGHDLFMPGVGVSGDGTAFLVFSESSPTDFVSSHAIAWTATGVSTYDLLIEEGDGTYAGIRWGDYVGVAADPSANAAVWQADEVPTADGDWRTVVSRLVLDTLPPTPPGAPNQALVANTTLWWDSIPVKVSWSAASDAGSGIARYELEAVDGGSATGYPTSTGTATSVTRNQWWVAYGEPAAPYRYRVRAIDGYGNAGTWTTGPALTPFVFQQGTGTSYSGTWKTAASSKYSGGTAKYSSTVGASVTFSFSGRSVAFVSYRSSTRGKVKVYVDSVYKAKVTLTSSTTMPRRIVYATGWSTSGRHKIKLVISSGRVDIDAFVVLK